MKIQTEIKIDSAHKLPNYKGKCSNLHGHTWKIVVAIETDTLDENDFVVDFTKVKAIVSELDHQNLNDYVENPTAENLAYYFANKIRELGELYRPEGYVGPIVNRFESVKIHLGIAEGFAKEANIPLPPEIEEMKKSLEENEKK